jgi:hypothetical protein
VSARALRRQPEPSLGASAGLAHQALLEIANGPNTNFRLFAQLLLSEPDARPVPPNEVPDTGSVRDLVVHGVLPPAVRLVVNPPE